MIVTFAYVLATGKYSGHEKTYFNIINVRNELVSIIPFWFIFSPATHFGL